MKNINLFNLKRKKNNKNIFSTDFIAIFVWIWLFFAMGAGVAVSYIFAILIHELGHFLIAKKLGYKLNKFSISGYGVSLSYFNQNINFKDEIKIAIAGPITNFISAFLVVGLWWIWPTLNFFTAYFVEVSVVLALFNLIPCYPMDGGRIFVNLASFVVSEKVAKKIVAVINIVLSILFLTLFVLFCFINFNPSYFLFAFFLIVGMLDLNHTSRYEKINIFDKRVKNFTKPIFICVDEHVTIKEMLDKISTSKTLIFALTLPNGKIINISEKMLINLSLNFDLNQKLKDIVKT